MTCSIQKTFLFRNGTWCCGDGDSADVTRDVTTPPGGGGGGGGGDGGGGGGGSNTTNDGSSTETTGTGLLVW